MSEWQPISTLPADRLDAILVTDGIYAAEAWRRGSQFLLTVCGCEFTDASHWMEVPALPGPQPDQQER